MQKEHKYLRRFANGWPVHALIGQYLKNYCMAKRSKKNHIDSDNDKSSSDSSDSSDASSDDDGLESVHNSSDEEENDTRIHKRAKLLKNDAPTLSKKSTSVLGKTAKKSAVRVSKFTTKY
jgi:hypothetical protein